MRATAKTPVKAKRPAEDGVGEEEGGLQRLVVDVVLDHDLEAVLEMAEGDDEEQRRDHGVERLGVGELHAFPVRAEVPRQREDEEDGERRERDRGDALPPPVADALVGRAEALDALPVGLETDVGRHRLPPQVQATISVITVIAAVAPRTM